MNAAAHQWTAGLAVGLHLVDQEQTAGKATLQPLAGGVAASWLTRLPDLVEPATSPTHRQFFHSLVFAAGLGVTIYKLHQWDPEDSFHKSVRGLGMLAISSYLIHLALDATTTKSLPLIGKL